MKSGDTPSFFPLYFKASFLASSTGSFPKEEISPPAFCIPFNAANTEQPESPRVCFSVSWFVLNSWLAYSGFSIEYLLYGTPPIGVSIFLPLPPGINLENVVDTFWYTLLPISLALAHISFAVWTPSLILSLTQVYALLAVLLANCQAEDAEVETAEANSAPLLAIPLAALPADCKIDSVIPLAWDNATSLISWEFW